MGLMNERATDQMGCAHPWPVLVDLWECVCVCLCVWKREQERQNDPEILANWHLCLYLFICSSMQSIFEPKMWQNIQHIRYNHPASKKNPQIRLHGDCCIIIPKKVFVSQASPVTRFMSPCS